jgi:hypothetical protein
MDALSLIEMSKQLFWNVEFHSFLLSLLLPFHVKDSRFTHSVNVAVLFATFVTFVVRLIL